MEFYQGSNMKNRLAVEESALCVDLWKTMRGDLIHCYTDWPNVRGPQYEYHQKKRHVREGRFSRRFMRALDVMSIIYKCLRKMRAAISENTSNVKNTKLSVQGLLRESKKQETSTPSLMPH